MENNNVDYTIQQMMQYANLMRLVKKNLNVSGSYTLNTNFEKDQIVKWLENPSRNEKRLRDLSNFLWDTSSHYRRIIDYFGTMLTFDYVVDLYNESTKVNKNNIYKRYIETINYLEKMNIKHEFGKLIYNAMINDAVYGYEYSNDQSFFFDILNPDYCAINGIEDGVYNFSFDFSYFDKYKDDLERFAPEFITKYNIYTKDKRGERWQELDSTKTICIKISEKDYTIPPLAGVFEEIYSLYDYKDLQMNRTELENYLLLVAKIPYMKDTGKENNFALSLDIANEYFNKMNSNLNDSIGTILSPFESIEPIKLTKNEKELDTVTLAENAVYNSSGTPRIVFNSDKASGAALNKAILMDEITMFKVLRQFERWINSKLKDINKKINFKVSFLDMTKYNQDELAGLYKEGSTLGLPVKTRYCASLGLSPSDVINGMTLENDVLDIVNNFIPLQSSYQTGDDKGGRKSKGDDIEEVTEGGQVRDDNDPENRG